MRKITTIILILVSTNCIAQDWAEKIAKNFYSTIDSSKKLDCCDKTSGAITIDYTHNNYELPMDSHDFLDPYYSQVMDSSTIEEISKDLIKSYYRIPKKYRDNFTKSCFNIETNTQVSRGYQTDLLFVEGKVHFVFSFQTKVPYKRTWLKKLFGVL
jgi:hypothetical protein